MLPSRCNPHGMRPWRRFPMACLPRIGVSIPTVISTYPDMIVAGTSSTMFHDSSGRRDFNHHLGLQRSDAKSKA
jgi:hypothetical protein